MAMVIGGLLLAAFAVLAAAGFRDLRTARNRLLAAKNTLSETAAHTSSLAAADGRASATQRIDSAIDEVTVAGTTVNGSFALRVARFIPLLSTQRSGVVRLIADSRTALGSTRTLLASVDGLAAQGKVTGARVPLGCPGRIRD